MHGITRGARPVSPAAITINNPISPAAVISEEVPASAPEPTAAPVEVANVPLSPFVPVEDVSSSEAKIGPWGIRKTSEGVVIDRQISDAMERASGGLFFTLEDKGFGKLAVLIAPMPHSPEVVEIINEPPKEEAMQNEEPTTPEEPSAV